MNIEMNMEAVGREVGLLGVKMQSRGRESVGARMRVRGWAHWAILKGGGWVHGGQHGGSQSWCMGSE